MTEKIRETLAELSNLTKEMHILRQRAIESEDRGGD